MAREFIARQSVPINAPAEKVWNALINPDMIRHYMFGTNVISNWREGSAIIFKGVWQGKIFEDKGIILRVVPERVIQYIHFSSLSTLSDSPENYHTVTFELSHEGDYTRLSISQDNNPTEQARDHSEKNWGVMLKTLKELLEK